MKRVRIMLTAIAVVGIVGGALAFKAKTYTQVFYCYKVGTPTGICTTSTPLGRVAIGGTGIRYTITTNAANCPVLQCTRAAQVIVNEAQ